MSAGSGEEEHEHEEEAEEESDVRIFTEGELAGECDLDDV